MDLCDSGKLAFVRAGTHRRIRRAEHSVRRGC
ncbi:hypothetical protein Dfulv_02120 [Dactylosporangium fulvum]|uniref:Uncharacterized protein n=1 Tax=Dactylosporangium fulvum TaxID=53359 RepID=A0ABY5WCK4_9ACTN|nr:hypothetical protein [Dactylosporangium fulvum]UWP87282.1 hypothetical protein Dfulv_02120 [Dactylosporangium fulvum]